MSDLSCIVIDDDEGILRLMGKMLSKMGFSVSLYDTWQSGFQSFEAGSYDLAILDVHMPGKDGFELARMMRHQHPLQKILIITGLDAGQVYRHLLVTDADFNDILYKPFSYDKIKLVVGEVMGMKFE
jgi:DNA-binding response OmpR family regulator